MVYVEFNTLDSSEKTKTYIENTVAKERDSDFFSSSTPINVSYCSPSSTPFRIQTSKFSNANNMNSGNNGFHHNQQYHNNRGTGTGGHNDGRIGRNGYNSRIGNVGGNGGGMSNNGFNGGNNTNQMNIMGGFTNMSQFGMVQGRSNQQTNFPNFSGGFNFVPFQGQVNSQGGSNNRNINSKEGGDWNHKRARHE